MKLSLAFSSILLSTLTASGATITNFTATASAGSPFTSTINTLFAGSTALVTNSSVSCGAAGPCSGTVLSFSLQGTGLTDVSPFVIIIDGSLSGATGATGTISLPSLLANPIPFAVSAGTFNTTILSTSLPALPLGAFSIAGTLGLSLAAGQTLSLPSSLSFAVGAPVPEPGTITLLGAGLLGIAILLRRRSKSSPLSHI